VRTFFTVLGHGSTEVGEVLRLYQEAGLVRVYGLRSEIEASHAAAALRWVTNEKAAVVTSIGPGALQALAASLVPASDGLGVWYLCGDETTEDEGFNMQQVPRHARACSCSWQPAWAGLFVAHPAGVANRPAARQCNSRPSHPAWHVLLVQPMNTQAAWLPNFNLDELPEVSHISLGAAEADYALAAQWIRRRSVSWLRSAVAGGMPDPNCLACSSAPARCWCIRPLQPAAFPTSIRRT